jgi:hypothetical protein
MTELAALESVLQDSLNRQQQQANFSQALAGLGQHFGANAPVFGEYDKINPEQVATRGYVSWMDTFIRTACREKPDKRKHNPEHWTDAIPTVTQTWMPHTLHRVSTSVAACYCRRAALQ